MPTVYESPRGNNMATKTRIARSLQIIQIIEIPQANRQNKSVKGEFIESEWE